MNGFLIGFCVLGSILYIGATIAEIIYKKKNAKKEGNNEK